MELQPMNNCAPRRRKRRMLCANCGINLHSNVQVNIPGISKIKDPHYSTRWKVVWIFMLIICSAVCIYLTKNRLKEYFSYPTSTRKDLQKHSKIKFPAFSICTHGLGFIENRILQITSDLCNETVFNDNSPQCMKNLINDLGVNLPKIWDEVYSFQVELKVENERLTLGKNEDFSQSRLKTLIGNCEVINHNVYTPFSNMDNQLTVTLSEYNPNITFLIIVHGQATSFATGWEFLYYKNEKMLDGYKMQVKISEEKFQFKNSSKNLCYAFEEESRRMHQCIIHEFYSFEYCRFPFLPKSFKECSLNDLLSVTFFPLTLAKLYEHCSLRRVCSYSNYGISVDYVVPSENENTTEVVVKFASDTTAIYVELYSYSFFALISDLFAYWGFFAALNAFVFLEIFEFIISKIYCSFKKRY